MYYICIENNAISSILNYKPNVPKSVQIVEITDSEHDKLANQTHIFDVTSKTLMSISKVELDRRTQEQKNAIEREFLNSTDWMIFRHIREKALGSTTTLTDQEYLNLETKRSQAASRVITDK